MSQRRSPALISRLLEELREWGEEEVYRMPREARGQDPLAVAPGRRSEAARAWAELEREIRACQECPLSRSRTQAVPGMGHRRARLMFIGEAPGFHEDQQGEPFVGAAGQLLTKILGSVGISREEVYITNIVKCRPPHNRPPAAEEIACCGQYLQRQIALIQPAIICSLGTSSTQALLQTSRPISELRGRVYSYQGLLLIPTYHPAALLRNPQWKRLVWEDMQILQTLYRSIG